ncbi:MAG: hypothetical protein ACKVS6_07510 [Planctomycetota bacterium]
MDRTPDFEPTHAKPLRVAMLPFENKSGNRSAFVIPFLPFIWLANLITFSVPEAGPDSGMGAATLRTLLAARLTGTPLRVVSTRATDTALAHKGLLAKAASMDPVELGKLLSVDAILFGELLDWSGNYYVLESRTVVEGRVRLVSCIDRSELVKINVGVSDAAGVSGGPTGYISAAASPLAALGKGPYSDLAVAWTTRVGDALSGDSVSGQQVPENPRSTVGEPYISAAGVTAPPPGGWRAGQWIEVIVLGAPSCTATFNIGTLRTKIPMVEFSRVPRAGGEPGEESAIYRGSYHIAPADRVVEAPVIVSLATAGSSAHLTASGNPITIQNADSSKSHLPQR